MLIVKIPLYPRSRELATNLFYFYANKLLELIENKEKRKKMSQNGWDYVKDKFHYTRLCENVEKLYLELLKSNKK